ncbi:MAG: hypothetical protein ACKVP5_18955 [Aestuariivirga sp.]
MTKINMASETPKPSPANSEPAKSGDDAKPGVSTVPPASAK